MSVRRTLLDPLLVKVQLLLVDCTYLGYGTDTARNIFWICGKESQCLLQDFAANFRTITIP